jgi:hypothetical protein
MAAFVAVVFEKVQRSGCGWSRHTYGCIAVVIKKSNGELSLYDNRWLEVGDQFRQDGAQDFFQPPGFEALHLSQDRITFRDSGGGDFGFADGQLRDRDC